MTTDSIFTLVKQISEMPKAEIARHLEYGGTPDYKHRVLLVGVYSEELLRPGITDLNWDTYGEKFDTIFTCFRFFDIEDKLIYDIPIHALQGFLTKSVCLNAIFHTHRPFCVTMLDGGRFEDLPVLATASGNVTKNDSFVLSYLCGKYPLLVNADGRYGMMKPKRVIQHRLEHRCSFYNL